MSEKIVQTAGRDSLGDFAPMFEKDMRGIPFNDIEPF